MTLNKAISRQGVAARAADKTKQGRALTSYEREFVIHMGVLGNTRRVVCDKFLEKYGRTLNDRTVTRIWTQNRKQMDEAQMTIVNQSLHLVSGDALKQSAYKLLHHRLERAAKDESEIEKLRMQYQVGEITKHEYDVSVGRYVQLTINELVKIAEMGFEHNLKNKEGAALTPEDQAALQMLTEGLKNGNPLQLIQVLNPTINNRPNA